MQILALLVYWHVQNKQVIKVTLFQHAMKSITSVVFIHCHNFIRNWTGSKTKSCKILYWHPKWKAQHHILVTLFQKPERQTSIEEKRKYVVAEILETEKSYVDALKMIQEASCILFPSQMH